MTKPKCYNSGPTVFILILLIGFYSCSSRQDEHKDELHLKIEQGQFEVLEHLNTLEWEKIAYLDTQTNLLEEAIYRQDDYSQAMEHLRLLVIYTYSMKPDKATEHWNALQSIPVTNDNSYINVFSTVHKRQLCQVVPDLDECSDSIRKPYAELHTDLGPVSDKLKLYLRSALYCMEYVDLYYTSPDDMVRPINQNLEALRSEQDSFLKIQAYLLKAKAHGIASQRQFLVRAKSLDSALRYVDTSDLPMIQQLYGQLFHIHHEMRAKEKAYEYASKLHEIGYRLKSNEDLASANIYMANAHRSLDNNDSSLYYRLVAQKYLRKATYRPRIKLYHNYINIATEYLFLGNIDKLRLALDSAKRVLRSDNIQDPIATARYHRLWAQSFFTEQKYDSALRYIDLSLQTSKQLGTLEEQLLNYADYQKIYAATGEFKKANEAGLERVFLQDSLMKENATNLRAEILFTDEYRLKQEELAASRLVEEKKIAEADKANKQTIIVLMALAILLLGGSLIIRQQRAKRFSAEKEKETSLANLARMESEMDAELKELERFTKSRERQHVAATIHDELLSELAGVVKQTENMADKATDDHVRSTSKSLSENTKEVYSKARSLLQRLQVSEDIGTMPEGKFVDQFSDFLERYVKTSGIALKTKLRGLNQLNHLSAEKQVQLLFSTKEILTNVLKHSRATMLEVIISTKSESVCLEFKDNGVGINQSTKGDGQGLVNIENRINKIDGTFEITDSDSRGVL